MIADTLMAQLDGARLVRYDPSGPVLIAWHGGHGLHVYDALGTEIYYSTVGDFAKNDADLVDVDRRMAELLAGDY